MSTASTSTTPSLTELADSIKAQATYNACCEVLTKMRGFFTGTERTALQELLQDY